MIDTSDLLLLGVSLVAGLVIAWLIRRLRAAEDAQHQVAATAHARAERLDAILNTTVDGIIVISATGNHRGVQPRRRAAVRISRSQKWSDAMSAC